VTQQEKRRPAGNGTAAEPVDETYRQSTAEPADVRSAALAWHDAGFCVLPTAGDGTKRPGVGSWTRYQTEQYPRAAIDTYDGTGIGLVCGAVSGGLEMLELEGRAVAEGAVEKLEAMVAEAGVTELWTRLTTDPGAYVEHTPSGGLHILARLTGAPVPGNTKLADRPATEAELDDTERALVAKGRTVIRGLAETRGEGGYVVVAPSHGSTHPNGKPWVLTTGSPGVVPTITAAERGQLHGLFRALDQKPAPPPPRAATPPRPRLTGDGVTPGDDFAHRTGWATILEPEGWREHYTQDGVGHWTRPGKSTGVSATTNALGTDRFHVHTSSAAPFEPGESYSKFGAWALLNHGGDHKAAARDLGRQGFGTPSNSRGSRSNSRSTSSNSQTENASTSGNTSDGESASHASQKFEPSQDEGDGEKESAATILVNLALARYTFGVSDSGETFAMPKDGPRVLQMLRGGKTSLRSQLSKMFFGIKRKAAPQQALQDALLALQGEAEEQTESTLYQRVARHDGALWLDLGDSTGKAVRIDGAGWSVQESAPVLFRRTALNAALPIPERGGNLAELWSWLNVTEEDRPLLAAWLVAALHDSIPHPVLGLFGEQGTGKTTAEKVLVSILDPSPVPTRKPPKDADSWVTAAQGSWVVGLDNLTSVPDWLSDSMCRAVTGDGDVRRQLYADNALVVFAFRRCLVVTGIDLGALNGDLADRMLTVSLDVIDDADRRDEADMWPGWAATHPRVLGAVLDLAASVEALLPSVRLAKKPRMADFAKILHAVDVTLGTDGLTRFMKAQSQMARDALTADPFIVTLAERISARLDGTFTGTSRQLLALVAPTDERVRPPKGWPATARTVTVKVHKQAPVMRKAGWTVTDDGGKNHDNAVQWTITPPPPEMARKTDSPDSQTRETGSEQEKPADDAASQARVRRESGESGESGGGQQPPCCGSRAPAGTPLVNACQLCPKSPTYFRAPAPPPSPAAADQCPFCSEPVDGSGAACRTCFPQTSPQGVPS
jgi:hypothetical protein